MKLDEKLLEKVPIKKDAMNLLGFIDEDSKTTPIWYEASTNRVFKEAKERHYVYLGKYIGHIPLNEGFIVPIVSFNENIAEKLAPLIDFSIEIPYTL